MQLYETYISKTGYVRNSVTGECYATDMLCIGKYSKVSDYSDISKEEYEAYVKEQEARYAEYER